jgi:hypothetical protein
MSCTTPEGLNKITAMNIFIKFDDLPNMISYSIRRGGLLYILFTLSGGFAAGYSYLSPSG